MQIRLEVHEAPRAWLDAALGWLGAQEVEANLALGIVLRLDKQPELYARPWYLATLHVTDESGARVVGAAVRTPPWHLVVHAAPGFEQAVANALVDDLLQRSVRLNGVNGRVPGSLHFAQVWQARTGTRFRLSTALRAFRLDAVVLPSPAPGRLRPAGSGDRDIVAAWLRAFEAESVPEEVGHRTEESIQSTLAAGTVHLWEDNGVPVSLVNYGRPLLRGMTIAPVYTPPERRGRGYASNAVASLSQQLLDAGHDFVCLFTDLANPTANHIYQVIGYRPVCDYADYSFVGEEVEARPQ
ncbi:MAG: GNAT family N-acetyltransferase [Caldilineaceae bacterium]